MSEKWQKQREWKQRKVNEEILNLHTLKIDNETVLEKSISAFEINPHITDGKMILSIGDAQRISNGERDTLTFIAMLIQAESYFIKKDNILIIDEVFDYMDDAFLFVCESASVKDKVQNSSKLLLQEIKAQFEKCAKSHPYSGDIESERELMKIAEAKAAVTLLN